MEELHTDILKTEMFKSSVQQQSYTALISNFDVD